MPSVDTYLTFNGNCADAMRFYERTLGGKIEVMMTHGESPMAGQAPSGSEKLIMHARLNLDGRILMASDELHGAPYAGMHGFAISLSYPKADDATRIFNALADGGKVGMPLQKTFWAEAFGMVTDKFGTPWMLSGGEHAPG